MSARRTLRDLRRGDEARAVDVLRLAFHYIIRGGWTPNDTNRAGEVAQRVGAADRPHSIERAIGRARADLGAKWMRAVEASECLRGFCPIRQNEPAAFQAWERDPTRTAKDVHSLFTTAINAIRGDTKGMLLDVAI